MGSMDQGSGPGVKGVGKDTTAGSRGKGASYGQAPNSFGSTGGVKGARGGAPNAAYPGGSRVARSAAQGVDSTTGGSPGAGGGVKSVAASSLGRGSPGAAAAPVSARRLTPVGGAPSDQNSRGSEASRPTDSTSPQEMANRRGFMGARPDGRPPGAEEPEA